MLYSSSEPKALFAKGLYFWRFALVKVDSSTKRYDIFELSVITGRGVTDDIGLRVDGKRSDRQSRTC